MHILRTPVSYSPNILRVEISASLSFPRGLPPPAPITVRVASIDEPTGLRLADDLLAWMRSEQDDILDGAIDLRHDRELFDTVLAFH